VQEAHTDPLGGRGADSGGSCVRRGGPAARVLGTEGVFAGGKCGSVGRAHGPASAHGAGPRAPGEGVHRVAQQVAPGPQDCGAAADTWPGRSWPTPTSSSASALSTAPQPPGCSPPSRHSPRSSACRTPVPSRSRWPPMPPCTLTS
ncbi:unnamed protein product, partial [Pipistrellus nathusii]